VHAIKPGARNRSYSLSGYTMSPEASARNDQSECVKSPGF